ncbi:MAG TPA: oxidative damage protection protein [Anaerolineae bacterium]|nr:oxidative damage protection protein [Anaerolineae bacterium]
MSRREVTMVVVDCAKLGQTLKALDKPPFPGELGERVFENISEQGWELWQRQATILINHYGLNMADPRSHQFLFEQMEQFFFGEQAPMPEGWTPEGSGAAPAPAGKAPRRK